MVNCLRQVVAVRFKEDVRRECIAADPGWAVFCRDRFRSEPHEPRRARLA